MTHRLHRHRILVIDDAEVRVCVSVITGRVTSVSYRLPGDADWTRRQRTSLGSVIASLSHRRTPTPA